MDFANIISTDLFLIFKIIFLFLIGLYGIFVIIIFNQIRSLNKIIYINKVAGSPFIQSLAFFYILSTLALFLLALAIL
jgi:hypothetical protein